MIRLLHLSSIPLVAALPIHNPPITPNAVTFLAVLSAILSISALLYVVKLFFRKSRQSWFTSLGALAPSSTPKFVHAQSGILVGFFGSPAWESTVTLNLHKTLHERRRSFFAVEYPPCASHIRSVSSFGQILEIPSLVYQPAKRLTPDTPRFPPALHDSAGVIPRRRYSLPSVVRPRTQYGQTRRSYSTKAKRGKHRKSDINPITFVPILPSKVVDDRVKHISPLSFSPLLDVVSCEDTNFFAPATKTLLTPPTPPYTVINFGSTLCNLEDEASILRQSFDLSVQESVRPLLSRQFTNALSPGDLDPVQEDAPADSDNDQFPPLNPVAVFKLRPRQKLSTIRTRRSPPLGPSPLRSMILPESSEADISITTCHAKPLCNQDILSPLPEDEATTFDTSPNRQRVIITRPTKVQDGGPDSVLGLIRELAEEVNDWDDSLFMDENFKSMIENSEEISQKRRKRSLLPKSPLDCVKERQITDAKECCMLSGGGQLVSFWEADPVDRDNIGIAH